MPAHVIVDGVCRDSEGAAIPISDRAFQYGDGLFETMRALRGRVRFLEDHLRRLSDGCNRLALRSPPRDELSGAIEAMARDADDAVVKLVVSRGDGARGYRPPAEQRSRWVLSLHEAPRITPGAAVAVRWCSTRLARSPVLAGMKHLNRLEQVLAQAEWRDPAITEGLMLDTEGELVCGTSSNVFACIGHALTTPDLRFAGVAGVMRRRVLDAARTRSIPVNVMPMRAGDLATATEVFITNAVTGIRPVARLDDRAWETGPITRALAAELELW